MRIHSARTWSRSAALGAVAVAVVLAFGLTTADAQGVPGVSPNKCLAGKTKCVNKKVAGLLKCREKCQKDPAQCGTPQTDCETKVRYKFDGVGTTLGCFEKLEAKDDGMTPELICTTTGDLVAMEERADDFVAGVVFTLEGGVPPPRFVDNLDGTVTDNQTGLMWEKKSDDGSINDKDTLYAWANAAAVHVAALNGGPFAGHGDWRLPTASELETIVDYGTASPAVSAELNNGCAPSCTVLSCSCTVSSFYWSDTSVSGSPSSAWYVDFNSGVVNSASKGLFSYVRAVRDA